MLYDLKTMLFELYKIYVYCKHCLKFFFLLLISKKVLLKTLLNIAIYIVYWMAFLVNLISYVTDVYRLLLPKVYLIFAFFAQCLWLQVISLRQIKFQ